MKKKVVFGLILALILMLSACGDDEEEKASASQTSAATQQTAKDAKSGGTVITEAQSALKVGDACVFGSYEQDNNTTNGKEPIEWIILDVHADGSYVMISKYALDCKRYNDKDTNVTWETSTLRKWLNEDFYIAAFSTEEQVRILPVALENEDNPYWGTTGGKATQDRVWLLSINEVTSEYSKDKAYSYFTDDASRKCAPTEYAVARGANRDNSYTVDGVGTCWWWLRSPGNDSRSAARVNNDGSVSIDGYYVDFDGIDGVSINGYYVDFDGFELGGYSVRPVVCVLP